MWPTIIRDLLSRKWLAFLLVEWLSFWALMTDNISGSEWEVISLAALGLFAGANVYQKTKTGPIPTRVEYLDGRVGVPPSGVPPLG